MSNLGDYQKITRWAKKVGGPKNLISLVAIGGYAGFRVCESLVKAICKKLKRRKDLSANLREGIKKFIVNKDGISKEGLEFKLGDEFEIVDSDGESVLIEKKGSLNNPFFVSADLLRQISEFE